MMYIFPKKLVIFIREMVLPHFRPLINMVILTVVQMEKVVNGTIGLMEKI